MQDVSEPMRMGEQVTSRWLDALLIQLERPEGHWLDVLSTLSLFWMPIGPSTRPDQTVHLQWKANRSDQSAFKFSAQLGKKSQKIPPIPLKQFARQRVPCRAARRRTPVD